MHSHYQSNYDLDLTLLCEIPEMWSFGVLSIFVVFCIGFFYAFYKNLLRAHAVRDTPTSKIRSAHQGYVELMGTVGKSPEGTLQGVLSKLPCAWYQYKIEHYHDKKWTVLEQGYSQNILVLEDTTGLCYVDPLKAHITTHSYSRWQGTKRYPNRMPQGFWQNLFWKSGPYRYTEWRMEEGMPFYALGHFVTFSKAAGLEVNAQNVQQLLKKWEKKHKTLLAQLLAQHSHATANQTEKTLSYQAKKEMLRDAYEKAHSTFNVLSGYGLDRRQPFIISTKEVGRLSSGYFWDAMLWALAFIFLFGLTASVIGFRISC
ncbi:MAG TPA: hypothetical protein VFP93_04650 [Gammaproteobacteria bacterium]|nr:hypothetical protein [Gammaproteobacteria bacterium]